MVPSSKCNEIHGEKIKVFMIGEQVSQHSKSIMSDPLYGRGGGESFEKVNWDPD